MLSCPAINPCPWPRPSIAAIRRATRLMVRPGWTLRDSALGRRTLRISEGQGTLRWVRAKLPLPTGQGAANLIFMSKVINLRTLRKQAARDATRRAGDENSARHGRTLVQKRSEQAQADKTRAHLDGHKRAP